jgi:hypothetical protein
MDDEFDSSCITLLIQAVRSELAKVRCRTSCQVRSHQTCEEVAAGLLPIVDRVDQQFADAVRHCQRDPRPAKLDLYSLDGQLLASAMEFTATYLQIRAGQIRDCCGNDDAATTLLELAADGLRAASLDVAIASGRIGR